MRGVSTFEGQNRAEQEEAGGQTEWEEREEAEWGQSDRSIRYCTVPEGGFSF